MGGSKKTQKSLVLLVFCGGWRPYGYLLHATAWSPLVVLVLVKAAEGPGWRVALAGLVSALALSTIGVEIVGQAFVAGAVLAAPRPSRGALARVAAAVALGFGLAAPSLLWLGGLTEGSARAGGLSTQDALAFSLHPAYLLQVLVAGLFGDLADFTNRTGRTGSRAAASRIS